MNLITKYGLCGLVLVWVLGLGLGFFKLQNLAPPDNPLVCAGAVPALPPLTLLLWRDVTLSCCCCCCLLLSEEEGGRVDLHTAKPCWELKP